MYFTIKLLPNLKGFTVHWYISNTYRILRYIKQLQIVLKTTDGKSQYKLLLIVFREIL